MADDVAVRLRLLDRLKFQRDAKAAQESVEDIGDEAKRSSRMMATMGKVGRGLGRTMGRALKYGAIAAAGAFATVGTKAVMAGMDIGESINKTKVIFKDNASAVLKWSETTGDALGIARADALEAAGGYGAMFQALGVGKKPTQEMSTSLVELAADMGSLHNQDPTEMLDKIRAGMSGEMEPLKRFGIVLSETAVSAHAVAEGIAKEGEELTEAQKVQARYSLLMKQSASAHGDFANTAESLPNVMRRMKASTTDALSSMGEHLLPTITEAANQVNDALGPAIQGMGPIIGRLVEAIGGTLGPLLEAAMPILGLFGETFALIAEALAPVLKMLGPILKETLTALMPGLRPVIHALGDGLLAIVKELGPVLPDLAKAFADIAIAMVPLIPVLVNIIKLLLQVGGPVILKIVEGIAWLLQALEPVFKALERFTSFWESVWTGVKNIASSIWGAIVAGVTGFVNAAIIGPINWVIDRLNSIQIHVDIDPPGPGPKIKFDWNGLQLSRLTPMGMSTSAVAGAATGRAAGGPMTAWRPYMVGERGPELVVPRVSSMVVPNHQLAGGDGAGLSFGGGGFTWNGDIHVHGSSDPEATARMVVAKLQDMAARR